MMIRFSLGKMIDGVRTPLIVLSAAILLAAMPIDASFGQWSTNPGKPTAISTAPNAQEQLCTIDDGAGGMIIAWQDFRSGSHYDIYAQHVNALGFTTWTPDGLLICNAPNDQIYPQMIGDGMGGAIIVWDDYRSGGDDDIYAQRVSASGALLWRANGVAVCAAENAQGYPRITACDPGGAIIAWQDWRSGKDMDIYAQRLDASGAPLWETDGTPVCTAPGTQHFPQIVSDGAGGAILIWIGDANSEVVLFAQHIDPSGRPLWLDSGVRVCPASGSQVNPQLISDGAGGAIVTWQDTRSGGHYKIYAQALNTFGHVRWSSFGAEVSARSTNQLAPMIAGDSTGGVLIVWMDFSPVDGSDILAQHISAPGTARWGASAMMLSKGLPVQPYPNIIGSGGGNVILAWDQAVGNQYTGVYAQQVDSTGTTRWDSSGTIVFGGKQLWEAPRLVGDGAGGALLAAQNYHAGTPDIYAQNVDASGHLGFPPSIVSVRDVANDQGGSLTLAWDRSHLDVAPDPKISRYDIYRSTPATAGERTAWELIASTEARTLEHYSMLVHTLNDSGPKGSATTLFKVRAYNSSAIYWDSQPDSGRSIDNLAPAGIGSLTAVMLPDGTVRLHWPADTSDSDLGGYVVYRSILSRFPLDTSSRLAVAADPKFVDPRPPELHAVYYRVTAQDVHGNEGPPSPLASVVNPFSSHLEQNGGPREFALEQNFPNPFNPTTTIRYALPVAAHVRLEVFTSLGTRVRLLINGLQEAGYKIVMFDASGYASGVYFYRLQAGPYTETKHFILLK